MMDVGRKEYDESLISKQSVEKQPFLSHLHARDASDVLFVTLAGL